MTYQEKRAEFSNLNSMCLFMLTIAERLEADQSPASIARAIDALRARGIDARDRANATLRQISAMSRGQQEPAQ